MSQPTREEVKTFIAALNYGMKVSHKPEFLIALAEGWLKNNKPKICFDFNNCDHNWVCSHEDETGKDWYCVICEHTVRRFDDKKPL